MKPTSCLQRALRRLPLTTKQAGKDYYKGTGSGSMGRHTKHGSYVLDYRKVRTYMVPNTLADFTLTPFVTKLVEKTAGKLGKPTGPATGESYLQHWKRSGVDWGKRKRRT